MPPTKQYKPRRTRGLGFVPPTLRHQHLIRLPFDKTDQKCPPAREAGEVGVAEEERAAESQGGEKSQALTEADSQEIEDVDMEPN